MKENDPLLYHEHPTSKKHPRMSGMSRAAQFAPFAALVGLEGELAETRRTTEEMREMDKYEIEEINRHLQYLCDHPKTRFALVYFVPDLKKSGGAYQSAEGFLKKWDAVAGLLILTDGKKIPIEKITNIEVYENESTQ